MIGATCFVAGCACDCDDKLGTNGAAIDTVGSYTGTANMGTNGNNGGATETGATTYDASTAKGGNGTSAGGAINSSTTTEGSTTKAEDPRTYNQSGGGMGYRTDTINEYKGTDGSARDKTGNKTNTPK